MKDKLIKKLALYNYSYKDLGHSVEIYLGFGQKIIVDFSSEGKVLITDKFHGYNPFAGRWAPDLAKAFRFNVIAGLLGALLSLLDSIIHFNDNDVLFFLFIIYVSLLSFILYTIRYYYMKKQIVAWLER